MISHLLCNFLVLYIYRIEFFWKLPATQIAISANYFFPFITARVRKGRYRWLSTFRGGVPHLADGGYPPSQVRMGLPDPRSGLGGTSCPGQNKGTPSQVRTEVRGTLGYPNIGTGWGYPHQDWMGYPCWDWMGSPLPSRLNGVPPPIETGWVLTVKTG